MFLPNGIGVSLVNHVPEELLYISLRAINLKYTSSRDGQSIVTAIEKIQVARYFLNVKLQLCAISGLGIYTAAK